MTAYVIEYNRISGEAKVTEFSEPGGHRSALEMRLALEAVRESGDVEIVSLVSDSLETVRKTHSRYFSADLVGA